MKSDYKPSALAIGSGTVWMSAYPVTANLDLSPACDYCRRVFAASQTNCAGCGAPRTFKAKVTPPKPIHFYSDESNEPVYTAYV